MIERRAGASPVAARATRIPRTIPPVWVSVGVGDGGGERMNDEHDGAGLPPEASGGRRMSRLKLLAAGAAGMAGASALGGATRVTEVEAAPRIKFFTTYEFGLVTALAEVIWPTDDLGPGAKAAGVGFYIDGQLDGGWGRGDRWYMSGPFIQPPDSGHG